MANDTGIYSIAELLNSRFASDLAVGFGFETITDILRQDLTQWNAQVTDQMSSLAMITTDRQGLTGTSTGMKGSKLDEFGSGKTKVERPGATGGFPLDRYGYPVGWTQRYMRMATVSDLAIKAQQVQQAFLRDIRFELRVAIFTSSNRSKNDIHVDNQTISVKAFLNADGDPIPDSPQDGTAFDGSTHTHYLAEAAFSAAGAVSLIDTVIEHSTNADLQVVIHRADASDWIALENTDGWVPADNIRIDEPARGGSTTRLVRNTTSNRYIGSLNEADVWVKPWGLPGYSFCYDAMAPKPLGYRQDVTTGFQGLVLVQDLFLNPLTTQFFEALFGVGALTRTNGAVIQHTNATYQDPTFTQ